MLASPNPTAFTDPRAELRPVLTIFEYLRKRAQDSVLAGVQDAIAQLDGKSGLAGKLETAPRAAQQHPATTISTENSAPAPVDPQKYLAGPGPESEAADGALPPPRRRGRPRTKGEQG